VGLVGWLVGGWARLLVVAAMLGRPRLLRWVRGWVVAATATELPLVVRGLFGAVPIK